MLWRKIKDKISQALNLHLNDNLSSLDILTGDILIFNLALDNISKDVDLFLKDRDYFYEVIDKQLPDSGDILNYDTSNKIDLAIFNIVDNFKNDFLKYHTLRLSSGKKKMLRAKLALTNSDNYNMAALIELFHLATLIQDDVIDKASIRRHKQTINDAYSNKVAILTSDLLLIEILIGFEKELKTFEFDKKNQEVSKFVFDKFKLVIDKMLDSELKASNVNTIDDYLSYISGKTANLFGLSYMLGNLNEDSQIIELENYFKIGHKLGIIFQQVDDFIDSYQAVDDTGKDASDLKNGITNYITLNNNNKEHVYNQLNEELNQLRNNENLISIIDEINKVLRRNYE